MKCELVRNLMSSYIDKDLNKMEKTEFEKHIAQCPLCREEYELLLEVVTECNDIEEAELPENFREELHQKLMQEKVSTFGKMTAFIKRQGWKAAAGAVAAVMIVAVTLGNPHIGFPTKGEPQAQGADQTAADRGVLEKGRDTAFTQSKNENLVVTTADKANSTAYGIVAGSPPNAQSAATPQKANVVERAADSREPITGRKVIRNGNITIKVTALDQKIDEIRKIAETSGGFVESSQTENMIVQTGVDVAGGQQIRERDSKFANIVIRIPADNFDNIFGTLKAMGKVVNENVSGNDITTQYRDTNTRVENLKVQEKRLLDLMAKANTVDETLRIENELNRIRTDIDIMTGELKNWDQQVALSTVYIHLTEAKPDELKTVDMPNMWGKAYNGFIRALNNIIYGTENLLIYTISGLPYLLIIGIVTAIIIFLLKRRKGKKT